MDARPDRAPFMRRKETSNMLKALKKVIRQWLMEEETRSAPAVSQPAPTPTQASTPVPSSSPVYASETAFLRATGQKIVVQQTSDPNGKLALPLRSILNKLSTDQMRLVRQLDLGDALVSFSTAQILSQIPKGSVQISFGELKKSSPPGVFSQDSVLDKTMVELPLKEIIARLDPSLMARRTTQKQVVVPLEVAGPFGNEGTERAPISAPLTSEVATNSGAAASAPTYNTTFFQKPADKITQSSQTDSFKKKKSVDAPKAIPQPMAPAAVPSLASQAVVEARVESVTSAVATAPAVASEDIFLRKSAPEEVATSPRVYTPIDPGPASMEAPTLAMPASADLGAIRNNPGDVISPIAPEPLKEPEPIRFSTTQAVPAKAQQPAQSPQHAGPAVRFLNVILMDVCQDWPQPLLQEIIQQHAGGNTLSVPFDLIQVALKQGKVALPWRIIRTWLQPASPSLGMGFEGNLLELPLKVITPLFMAELKTSAPRKKVVVDQSIPDLFSGTKTAEESRKSDADTKPAGNNTSSVKGDTATFSIASAQQYNFPRVDSLPVPVEAPVTAAPPALHQKQPDTNYFSKPAEGDPSQDVVSNGSLPPSLGTKFMKRYATPNEIVAKASSLPGVAGSLVALPDGLLVASQIPSSMNAQTIAAFLPQMFARVGQCTKELRLGELNNLSFTVGVVPWKIFKVGAIYFAAFGREGEPMSTADLARIAAELDRNSK